MTTDMLWELAAGYLALTAVSFVLGIVYGYLIVEPLLRGIARNNGGRHARNGSG